MFRLPFPRVVQRDSIGNIAQACHALRRVRTTPCSLARVHLCHVPLRPYSTNGIGATPLDRDKIDGDALRKMDIDAMETISKYWIGDHSTWSHKKLLGLMVCKLQLSKHE
jgi:hypothetical protein